MAVEGGIRIPGEIATGGGDGGGETKSGPLSTLGDDARARGKSNMGETGEAHENGSGKAVNKDSNPGHAAAGENTRDTETSGDAVADLLRLTIESIPSYVEQSAMMLVLVPVCEHADRDGEACGYQSWRQRGWCRTESMSAVLARTNVLIMVGKGTEAQPEFVKSADALLLAPGQGDFTCCWNGHKMGGLPVPCDKVKIRLVLEAMLAAKIDDLYDPGAVVSRPLHGVHAALVSTQARARPPPSARGCRRGGRWSHGKHGKRCGAHGRGEIGECGNRGRRGVVDSNNTNGIDNHSRRNADPAATRDGRVWGVGPHDGRDGELHIHASLASGGPGEGAALAREQEGGPVCPRHGRVAPVLGGDVQRPPRRAQAASDRRQLCS